MDATTDARLVVLVPDDEGQRALHDHRRLRPVTYDPDEIPDPMQRAALVLVVRGTNVDRMIRYMHALPRLELVQTLGSGVERWQDVVPAGVRLGNAAGAHGTAVAEWIAATLLAHVRDLRSFAGAQAEGRWAPHPTGSLRGKRVAVLGAGNIGSITGRILEVLGCEVVLVGRATRDGVTGLAEFLPRRHDFDVVVLALPTSPSTRGLVDAAFLRGLRDGGILVNAGRGELVDSVALVAELSTGRIHAILDVTDPEPLPAGHVLWTAPNVVITPHVAASTSDFWLRAWRAARENIERFAEARAW